MRNGDSTGKGPARIEDSGLQRDSWEDAQEESVSVRLMVRVRMAISLAVFVPSYAAPRGPVKASGAAGKFKLLA